MGFQMPVLLGGLSVGLLWFFSLSATLVLRFRVLLKKWGLLISHVGLLVLLLGQFLTQVRAKESQMSIDEGQSAHHSESYREMELVFIDSSSPNFDTVISVPQSLFQSPRRIVDPRLPFTVVVRRYYKNANLTMSANPSNSQATQGIGTRLQVEPRPPVSDDNQVDNTTALVEILDGEKSLGTWLVSAGLGAPQSFFAQGKEYHLAIRLRRTYYPFSLTLKDFKHDRYPGTDIPKNFSSLVTLNHPDKNEERDVLIYMNHPLRYEGKTFYQASFGKNDTLSVLQVVENPAWLTPYMACILVALGLLIHFFKQLAVLRRPR